MFEKLFNCLNCLIFFEKEQISTKNENSLIYMNSNEIKIKDFNEYFIENFFSRIKNTNICLPSSLTLEINSKKTNSPFFDSRPKRNLFRQMRKSSDIE